MIDSEYDYTKSPGVDTMSLDKDGDIPEYELTAGKVMYVKLDDKILDFIHDVIEHEGNPDKVFTNKVFKVRVNVDLDSYVTTITEEQCRCHV
jgi:hypothetical protein